MGLPLCGGLFSLSLALALVGSQRSFGEEKENKENSTPSHFRIESAGVRYGFGDNDAARGLQEAEIFSNFSTPLRLDLGEFNVRLTLDASAGWLGGHSEDAFIGTLGPSLRARWGHIPLELVFGSSPSYLSSHHFGDTDISTDFQFTTHVGINWDITRRIQVGYSFVHISNGGIADPNPGLHMHMFGVGWLF
jgi:hypothetical protein